MPTAIWIAGRIFISAASNTATRFGSAGLRRGRSSVSTALSRLSYAAMNGHADIVRALLRAGANSGFVSTHGHTALSLATARQHAEVIELLLAEGTRLFRNWHI